MLNDRAAWVERYMRELDRKKRVDLLAEAIEEEGLTPANELRQKLVERRYDTRQGQDLDYFIRGWMTLYYLHTTSHGLFAKQKLAREGESIRKDWQLDLCAAYGAVGETVLYEELYNMTLLYISLCKKDKNYGSFLLGLGKMSQDSLDEKIAKDVFHMAYTTPAKLPNGQETFRVFRLAATDAFCEAFPDNQELLRSKIRSAQ